VIAYIALAMVILLRPDPAPGLLRSKADARQIDCTAISEAAGSQQYPGRIKPEPPRGDFIDKRAVICRERLMRAGLRDTRDEAVLSTLRTQTAELAAAAVAQRPDLGARSWLVEAYYPSVQVSGKIRFSTADALVSQGVPVSDRTPVLAAGDIDVITRMAPQQAYPAACARYAATGSLGEDDVLLAVMVRDPRETILHAGLCEGGRWSWLR